jgi:hypothetical protein
MESRELAVQYGWGLRSRSRLGQDSDVMVGQGMVEDVTFRDLDRDGAGMGTWHDEDGDVKAW